LLTRLAYAKRLELEARSDEDCAAAVAGIALAREALSVATGREYRVGDFVFAQGQKPLIHGTPSFSISHSRSWVGCAVASHGAVGFDIEDVDKDGPGRVERWMAVEATLKAAGRGMRSADEVELDLGRQRSRLEGAEYLLTQVALTEGRTAFLATALAIDAIEVRAVDLDRCLEGALPCASGADTIPGPSAQARSRSRS